MTTGLKWGINITTLIIGVAIFFVTLVNIAGSSPTKAQSGQRKVDAGAIRLPDGYKIEPIVTNLSVPTTAVFDGNDLIVAESGFAKTAAARLVRIRPNGETSVIAQDGLNSPVTGLLMVNGTLYVSHREKVSKAVDGKLEDIVAGLPSEGDHQNNNIVLGPDGKIYLGQGTRTNSAVVGEDNYLFGWLSDQPNLSEIPCRDISLTGQNFESGNPLVSGDGRVTTGAYKPFGQASKRGEVVKGNAKCGGSVVRFNPDGSGFELVAWGLRNPFGLKFDKNGQLWATSHGADVRGSRPIFNDPDYLVQVKKDAWYGWPDYSGGKPVPNPLWQNHPPLTAAYMFFPPHSAANGLAISRGGDFGFPGDAFVAEFGTFAPVTTGVNVAPSGFRVVRINLAEKTSFDFAGNILPGPNYINRGGGLDRPSDVLFGPDGALYVVDWGSATVDKEGLKMIPGTGVVWRVYSEKQNAVRPSGPVAVSDNITPISQRLPLVKNAPELYKALIPQIAAGLLVLAIIIAAVVFMLRVGMRRM